LSAFVFQDRPVYKAKPERVFLILTASLLLAVLVLGFSLFIVMLMQQFCPKPPPRKPSRRPIAAASFSQVAPIAILFTFGLLLATWVCGSWMPSGDQLKSAEYVSGIMVLFSYFPGDAARRSLTPRGPVFP
jgi:ABC-type transport system involved in cytochrome c biogenesis permease subunit